MRLVVASVLLAACGPAGTHNPPDARSHVDAPGGEDADLPVDAPIDASPTGCDYTEQHDATNDDVSDPPGTPEQTGLTIGARTVVCGKFEHTHFDSGFADVDGYVITVPSATDVLVRLHGAGAETIEYAGVDVYSGPTFTPLVGSATFYGDHGVVAVHLPAGTYELTPFALNSTALTSTIAYKLEVTTDAPATRCPEVTTGGYAEAHDGADSTGNDVITIPSGAPTALTTSTTDMPEPTGLLLDTGSTRLTGSAADVTITDQYEDKDTFAFSTGAATNELTVRLTWPGTGANLDFLVFEAGSPSAVDRTIATTTQGPELRTFSVKPNTSYWLLVGAKTGSTGFPVAYAATVCSGVFVP